MRIGDRVSCAKKNQSRCKKLACVRNGRSVGIFKRLFDAPAAVIVFPAMVRAADTVVLDKTIVERSSAMRTVLADETVSAVGLSI